MSQISLKAIKDSIQGMRSGWKRDTLLFLLSQNVSIFGSLLIQYAITWHITLQTQSGVMLTMSIICGFLPTFLLSPFAGVWADRYDRKLLIILSDATIAMATLTLAILFYMGYDAIWLLFVMSAIRALGTAVQMPAVSAFLPQIVPEEELTRVNALNGTIQSTSMLLAPMLSGALLTLTAIETIFFIDVVTAAIAIFILLFLLHVPSHARALEKKSVSYFTDMREGIAYICEHDFVRTFLIFNGIFCILAAPVAFLTPLQVARSFGSDVWRLTVTEITFSVGMMAGGIIMASWGGFKNKVHSMVLSNFIIGFCTFALGVIPVFWIYLLFMGLAGVAMPIFNTPFMVLLQQRVAADFLGRVFGVFGMIASISLPLGMLLFGPISDFIRIEWLLMGTGSLLLVVSRFMLSNKVLLTAGQPDGACPAAAQPEALIPEKNQDGQSRFGCHQPEEPSESKEGSPGLRA